MLSLLTAGFIFLEEIEPCQFEIQNFPVTLKFREVLNSGATGDFNLLLAALCFTLARLIFPLLNHDISSRGWTAQ